MHTSKQLRYGAAQSETGSCTGSSSSRVDRGSVFHQRGSVCVEEQERLSMMENASEKRA